MLVPSTASVMEELLKQFKPCFTKPQFRNFSTYILGLVASEGKKNVDAINRCFMEHKDQSTLNRFLTASPWSIQRLELKRLTLARQGLPAAEGSTGTLLIDDTINEKTGKHMEEAGYHYDSSQGKAVWGHDLVTTHYVNGEAEYPARLSLYVKKDTCHEEKKAFKTKIMLAVEQIEAFTPPVGTGTVVAFDSWYFCQQIVEAVASRGWGWVTQAEANRVIHLKGERMNVTRLAESLPERRFRKVKIGGEAFTLCGFRAWMSKVGEVRLVVSRGEDGFHFYASNRLEWTDRRVVEAYRVRQGMDVFYRDVKQNLGLEEYQVRRGRGAIIHWHLVFTAYTLLALLRRSLVVASSRLGRVLGTLGGVCRWVKRQCFRRLVDWLFLKFKQQMKPEPIYRRLGI